MLSDKYKQANSYLLWGVLLSCFLFLGLTPWNNPYPEENKNSKIPVYSSSIHSDKLHSEKDSSLIGSSYPISQVAVDLGVSRSFLYNIQKDQNYSLDSKNQQTSGTESLNFIPFNFVDPNQPQKNQFGHRCKLKNGSVHFSALLGNAF